MIVFFQVDLNSLRDHEMLNVKTVCMTASALLDLIDSAYTQITRYGAFKDSFIGLCSVVLKDEILFRSFISQFM